MRMETCDFKLCKYCTNKLEDCSDEGLTCTSCSECVHLKCLKSGGVPGGLAGDVFFVFTCQECTSTGIESFVRDKISWLKVLVLVLYHLQTRSPGLGRKGYFHWRNHVAALIDKDWEILFPRDFKRKKKWVGTVAGTLSHFSMYFFKSGTAVISEPAWWALTYPKLSPNVTANIYADFTNEKQKLKLLKTAVDDVELFKQILHKQVPDLELLTPYLTLDPSNLSPIEQEDASEPPATSKVTSKQLNVNKRKSILPTMEEISKKIPHLDYDWGIPALRQAEAPPSQSRRNPSGESVDNKDAVRLLDPFCYYNTALADNARRMGLDMQVRLTGGLRVELIRSPYSNVFLKPYIRRDVETYPHWIKMMDELQLAVNEKNEDYVLPAGAPIDYVYVQPEHIPAINSLCNIFFWPGIDVTDCLKYPEFSCVVMYRRLIVAFAFMVPNVAAAENYISFMFTRPGWRNVGIAKFMLYHLTQVSVGKDITLHVSVNNPALLLYQKFCFKAESFVQNFYEKYMSHETGESKHAFFCRLERG